MKTPPGARLTTPAQSPGAFTVELPALVPAGIYTLAFLGWTSLMYLNRQPKLALHFRIIDYGPYFGTEVIRWYNAQKLTTPPRRNGRFKLGGSSDLLRDFVRLTGLNPRKDRVALSHLDQLVFRGRVETVRRDRRQRSLPAGSEYSVIRELDVVGK